ncbi:hypothetical protein ACL02S_13505 [Nocardia sp. 004]|uniref:hypothetical protein n=1 Tax=Nocardia sp. 004 TaxID=3385978 RepID=UPI0039A0BB20
MKTPTGVRPTIRRTSALSAEHHIPCTTHSSEHGHRWRRLASTTAATAVAATMVLIPVPQATAVVTPAENRQASAAVTELTTGVPGELVLPADFITSFGYRPSMVDGLVVNPRGSCSTPVPLPTEFDTACKAHDLGYDLLRYADQRGGPLGPWARRALDLTLGLRMQQACTARSAPFSRTRCEVMAAIASTAVDLNSRRQDYGVPIAESLLGAAGSDPTASRKPLGLLAAVSAGLSAVLLLYIRRRGLARPAFPPHTAATVGRKR